MDDVKIIKDQHKWKIGYLFNGINPVLQKQPRYKLIQPIAGPWDLPVTKKIDIINI